MTTDVKRLSERVREKGIPTEPEPLTNFENCELTLRSFVFQSGNFSEYALMDCVDENGVAHLLTTGGMSVLRILHALEVEEDLPVQVRFVKVVSGTGRKVWSIE